MNERWLGATAVPDGGCSFLVWAPRAERVEVHLLDPVYRLVELEPRDRGYFAGTLRGVGAGGRYRFGLDGAAEHADPASRSQPEGVHGPSEVYDPTRSRGRTAGGTRRRSPSRTSTSSTSARTRTRARATPRPSACPSWSSSG